jgi:hypothetical protein
MVDEEGVLGHGQAAAERGYLPDGGVAQCIRIGDHGGVCRHRGRRMEGRGLVGALIVIVEVEELACDRQRCIHTRERNAMHVRFERPLAPLGMTTLPVLLLAVARTIRRAVTERAAMFGRCPALHAGCVSALERQRLYGSTGHDEEKRRGVGDVTHLLQLTAGETRTPPDLQ